MRIPRNAITLPKSDSFYTDSVPAVQNWKSMFFCIGFDFNCDISTVFFFVRNIDGIAIDPECKLKKVHVYCRDDLRYVAVMALVDIVENKNSYYRIQLLESDDMKR